MILFASEVCELKPISTLVLMCCPVPHNDRKQLEHYLQVRCQCYRSSVRRTVGEQVSAHVLHRPCDRYARTSPTKDVHADLLLSVLDFMKLSIYLAFFSLILTFYGLPINVLRDVYLTARSFLRKCRDLKRWREATKNMGSRYATATEAEMQHLADKTCIICREEMQYEDPKDRAERLRVTAPRTGGWFRRFMPKRTAQDDTPKKLLCGHVFHFHCLRSWLERQQSCPTWSVHLVLTSPLLSLS